MEELSSYHTADDDVYHTHADCPIGKLIPAKDRKAGEGDKAKCDTCKLLDAAHRQEPPR
jgi:hypothetical protein